MAPPTKPKDLWPKEIKEIAGKSIVERKVERILEMSFDHTAAMISLLEKEHRELKVESLHHRPYINARRIFMANIQKLKDNLAILKVGKGNKLEVFQHKCQEFGI